MTKDEALKLALDALEKNQPINYCMNSKGEKFPLFSNNPLNQNHNEDAITAIKEALAQPEQKPMAWLHKMDNTEGLKANGKGVISITQKRKHPFGKPGVDFSKSYPVTSTPLYPTPPQRTWVGLTDEELLFLHGHDSELYELIKTIEAKLKEKNEKE